MWQVILMERESPAVWADSYLAMLAEYRASRHRSTHALLPWLSTTHNKVLYSGRGRHHSYGAQLARLACQNMILSAACPGPHTTPVCRSLWEDQYIRHGLAVRAAVDPEKLLVLRTGEGWQRLCEFLGRPVPDTQALHTTPPLLQQ